MITQKYKEKEGINIFHDDISDEHADYNSSGLDNLYRVEEKHFWFISRKEFIFQQMKKQVLKTAKIIEIGAGTGNVSRFLKKKKYENIAVGEMHLNGLKYAQSYGIKECYQFDLLRSPFEKEFNTICLFDVLEHIADDQLAIANVYKMLTNDGKFILTVPAHLWLWNREDSIAGHKQRYTKNDLINKLEKSGFKILTARYFFISITPLLWLRRLLNRDDDSQVSDQEHKQNISINPISNKILLYISRLENKLNHLLPNLFGGSLLIIGQKI